MGADRAGVEFEWRGVPMETVPAKGPPPTRTPEWARFGESVTIRRAPPLIEMVVFEGDDDWWDAATLNVDEEALARVAAEPVPYWFRRLVARAAEIRAEDLAR